MNEFCFDGLCVRMKIIEFDLSEINTTKDIVGDGKFDIEKFIL